MNEAFLSNNRKFLIKYITSYSILLIIILIMGLYMYKLGIDDAKAHLFKQSYINLSQSVSDMDNSFQFMAALSTQIADNSNIIRMLKTETDQKTESFYLSAAEAMKFLSSFGPSETFLPIRDYFIYLPKTDYLLSSTYFNRSDLYYRLVKYYNPDYYEEWLSILSGEDSHLSFYETYEAFPLTHNPDSPYLYLIPIKKYTMRPNVPGVICFEIDRKKLSNLFADLPLFEKGFLYVVDKNQNTTFSITDSLTPSFSHDKILELIHSADKTCYFKRVRLETQNLLMTCITSSYNGWSYYLFQPEEMVFSSLLSYHKIYSFITIGACLLSFLVILILSKKNLAPFFRIRTQLENTLKEHSSLQRTLEEQKQIIYQSYVDRLISGQVHNEDELNYISRYLKICTQNRKFCVLYITAYYVDSSSENDTEENFLSPTEQTSYRKALLHEFREIFGEDILIHQAAPHSFALLVGSDESWSIDSATAFYAGQFLTLQNQIRDRYPFYLFCGMGNRNRELSYTWKSFQQAIQAIEHATNKAPFQSYKRLDKSLDGYYFPLEFAQKLTEFVTSGNKKQVKEFLHLIKQENQKERTLTPQMEQLLFSDIRNTLYKIRFSVLSEITESSENDALLEQIDFNLENNSLNFSILSDAALWLTSFYEPKQREGNQLIRTIQEYIREHYVDSSLCLNKISDEFGISESYFSYLFKAETKTNFSEYLEKLRMDQALVLLETTNIPVSNLYLEVGYNNANSFRRAFKKVHGVSPKAVRDSVKFK